MDLVYGVDVSEWEPKVDWRTLRTEGVRFALIRATSGIGYIDKVFKSHWEGARREGILRGAYHYLIAGQDAVRQAELFIATLGSDRGELPPIVDLEDKYNEAESNRKIITTCKAVLDRIEQAFGRKPMIYSRRTFLQDHATLNSKPPSWGKDYHSGSRNIRGFSGRKVCPIRICRLNRKAGINGCFGSIPRRRSYAV